MSKNWVALLLVLGSIPLLAKAECAFVSPSKRETITINPGITTLTVPRDKTGSLFVSSFASASANVRFTCNGVTNQAGVRNSTGGTQPDAGTANIPIGTTGLFWRWRFTTPGRPSTGLLFSYGTTGSNIAGGSAVNNLDGRTYAFEVFSNAPVAAGTVIPAGTYGTFRAGTLDVLEIKLSNSITIATTTCVTPDVTVPMSSHKISDFPATGTGPSSQARKGFPLQINDCPQQISAVKYQFNVDSSKIADSGNGIIKLDNPDDVRNTAQGVGLQLRDSAGLPVKFNEFIPFTEFVQATAGTTRSHRVDFDATYFKIRSAAVTAGNAKATITFTMLYL